MSERRKPANRVVSIGKNSNELALGRAMCAIAGDEVWSTTTLSLALNSSAKSVAGVLLLHYSLPLFRKTGERFSSLPSARRALVGPLSVSPIERVHGRGEM